MEKLWLRSYEKGVSPDLDFPSQTIPQVLFDSCRKFADHTALIYYGRKISYRELDTLSNRLAQALIGMGLREGDRVAIMLPNVPQCVISYMGALKAGAIVVQTNPLYVEREIEQQLEDSGAETLIALDLFYDRIKRIKDQTPLKRILICNAGDYLPPLLKLLYPLKARMEGQWARVPKVPPTYDFVKTLQSGEDTPVTLNSGPEDVALLQYTGGTTGVPKGVMLTHRNILANAFQCGGWMPSLREGGEIFLGVIPFFHVYGLSACMNLGLMSGSTLVLLPKFKTREVLDTIVKYQVSIFMGVQAMYVAINNFEGIDRYDLSPIRICISGAGPLHVDVQERFEELTGGKLVEGYGLSEASPVTHATPIFGRRKKGSIGLPFPGTEAKIVDKDDPGKELGVGETGELAVRGPQVMKGYWKRDDETQQVLKNGWLYTGDIARVDEEGFFFIVDRKKDMIKTRGENVYPREIEEVLYRNPKVKDAVAVGLPDEFSGEVIKAYVVLKEGQSSNEEEMLGFCRKELAKFKVPKWVEFREELPKTMVGKVLRRVLIEEEREKRSLKAGGKFLRK